MTATAAGQPEAAVIGNAAVTRSVAPEASRDADDDLAAVSCAPSAMVWGRRGSNRRVDPTAAQIAGRDRWRRSAVDVWQCEARGDRPSRA
jgi:hypothetical protein